jgi:alpha-1,2-mannosyltransferase
MNVVKQPLLILAIIGFVLLIYQWQKRDVHDIATDYNIYYKAAQQFKADPSILYDATNTGFDQYLYPPPAILLFVLCTFIPYQVSYWIFSFLMYASLIGSLFIGQKIYNAKFGIEPSRNNYLFIAFALTTAPMFHNITLGQVNCLVLLLCMLYLYFAEKKPVLAGIFLAAACWIKVYPVLLILWGVFSKERRKSVYACMISGTSVVLLLALLIPFDLYFDFARKLLLVSHYSCSNPINQSVTGFFLRFHVPFERIFMWPNVYEVPAWIRMLNYALLAITLAVTSVQLYRNPNNISMAAVLLALIPLFSPLGWGHSFVFMLPLVMLCIQAIQKRYGQTWITFLVIFGIGFLLLIPVYNAPGILMKFPLLLQNLYYSRLALITALCILMIFMVITRQRNKEQKSTVV